MEHAPSHTLEPPVFIEALPQMAFVTDARGRVVRFNERWLCYVGGEGEHRRSWLNEAWIHEDDIAEVRDRWLAARSVGSDVQAQLRMRRFDGEYRWHMLEVAVVHARDGSVLSWVGTCTDIHEQKQLERELQFQRSVLEAQGEASLDAILLVSPDRTLLWANQQARQLWGQTELDVPLGSDMRAAALRTAHRALDPGTHMEQLERMYAEPEEVLRDDVAMADGRFMERFSAPVRAPDGEILGRVNSYRDVTARVKLVGELEREREQLRATLDQVNELARTLERLAATAVLTGDARLSLRDVLAIVNEQARLLVGSSLAVTSVGGRPALDEIEDVISPVGSQLAVTENVQVMMLLQAPLVAEDGTPVGTIRLLGKDDADGFTDADQAVLVQIAQMGSSALQSRLLVAELRERAHAALALSHVADAVFLMDSSGTVHLWNPSAERITGLPAVQVLGHRLEEVLPAWPAVDALIPSPAPGDEQRQPVILPLELPTGEVWISITAVRYDGGTVFAFRDVTDERRIEQMRSDIVATVSHELRTPLTSIYGMALTLQRPDHEIDDAARGELVAVIVEQAARLGSIIDDILVASSLEAGSLEVRRGSVEVVQVTQDVVDLLMPEPRDGIRVETEFEAPDVMASGDVDRIRQVLGNILENAIKYSPKGGLIHVRVSTDDDRVHIAITDNGLGIPPEEQDRVFEKFYRLDPGMARGIPGTGLGLYISRELARQMDGDVTVISSQGAGATFTLHLPRA